MVALLSQSMKIKVVSCIELLRDRQIDRQPGGRPFVEIPAARRYDSQANILPKLKSLLMVPLEV